MDSAYPYTKMAWYPHMGQKDAAIWSRFLDKYPDAFDTVIYDVAIGEGNDVPDEAEEYMVKDWKILTKYKCDVVAYKDGVPTVIEIKPRAGLHSIGQIICYQLLYQEYIKEKPEPNMMIVTDEMRKDMDWMCEEHGINLVIV
jgi:hypothetical protein